MSPNDSRHALHRHPAYAATHKRVPLPPDGRDGWIQASEPKDRRGMRGSKKARLRWLRGTSTLRKRHRTAVRAAGACHGSQSGRCDRRALRTPADALIRFPRGGISKRAKAAGRHRWLHYAEKWAPVRRHHLPTLGELQFMCSSSKPGFFR